MPAFQSRPPIVDDEPELPLGLLDPDTAPWTDWQPSSGAAASAAAGAAEGASAAWSHYTEDPLLDDLTDEEKQHISPTINPDAIDVPGAIPKYY